MDYRSILVINLGGIGDVLLSTPALRALHERFPRARLDLLVVPRCRELLSGLTYLNGIYTLERSNPARLLGNILTLRALRQRRYDLGLNMRTLVTNRGARFIKLLLSAIRPSLTAGRNTCGRGVFFNISIPEELPGERFEADYDQSLVESLGAAIRDRSLDLTIAAQQHARAEKIIRASAHPERMNIAVHPGGKPSHRWPLERFALLMRRLAERFDARFFLTGDRNEKKLCAALARRSAVQATDLSGALSLKELAALLLRCRLLITNDTGTMHLAAAQSVPLVAIFGPGYLKRYDPRVLSAQSRVVFTETPCAPCDRTVCADARCLGGISVEQVLNETLRALGEPPR